MQKTKCYVQKSPAHIMTHTVHRYLSTEALCLAVAEQDE